MINGKHGQKTHSTKMGADELAENTPNAEKFICPICLPMPKSLGFGWKKASSGVCNPWFVQYIIPNLHGCYNSWFSKQKLEKACCICSWRKKAIQLWSLWLQIFSKGWLESECCNCSWRKWASIQMWSLWVQLCSKGWLELACCFLFMKGKKCRCTTMQSCH